MPTLPTPLISCGTTGSQWICGWDNQNQMGDATPTWFENGVNVGPAFSPLDASAPAGSYHAYLVVTQLGFHFAQSDTKTGP
jgi:hypothetical protein